MTHNANEVLQSSRQLHRSLQAATMRGNDAAADELQAAIRSNIPSARGRRAGGFEGYAARGVMWSDVQRTRTRRVGLITVSEVYMRPGQSRVYQRIHEHGGVIRAKRPGGYLRFKVRGRWVQVRQVRIRAKRYFSGPRVQAARPRIEAAIARVLSKVR